MRRTILKAATRIGMAIAAAAAFILVGTSAASAGDATTPTVTITHPVQNWDNTPWG
jgi:hypothetical protein